MLLFRQQYTSKNGTLKSTYLHGAEYNHRYGVQDRTVLCKLTGGHSQLFCTEIQIVFVLTMFT